MNYIQETKRLSKLRIKSRKSRLYGTMTEKQFNIIISEATEIKKKLIAIDREIVFSSQNIETYNNGK